MSLLFSQGNTVLADILDGTKPLQQVALSSQFHSSSNYGLYIRPGRSLDVPITFDISGTLESLIITSRFASSHFEGGTVIQCSVVLQEDVSGTWTDRATASFLSDEFLDYSVKIYNMQDIHRLVFDTPFAIDTDASKWRFHFKNDRVSGTDAGYWYLMMVKNDAAHPSTSLVMLPVLQETQIFDPATDVLWFQDTITSQDDTVDFGGVDVTGYGWYAATGPMSRLAIVPISTKLSEPSSIFHILKPTLPEVTIGIGGNFYLTSTFGKREPSLQVGTEAEPITIDHRVNFLSYNHSSGYKGMFHTQTTTNYGQHREIRAYGTLGNFRTQMSEDHTRGDTEIKVDGDFSFWKIGESIQTTFPRYQTNYSNADYNRIEIRKITSVDYDAGTDVTTLGIDVALDRYYDLASYGTRSGAGDEGVVLDPADFPFYIYNIQQSAPTHIGAKDGDYCNSSNRTHKLDTYRYMRAIEFNHFAGVLLTDWYRQDLTCNVDKYRNADDTANFLWKDVMCWNNYTNFYMPYLTEGKLINVSSFKGSLGAWAYHINATRAARLHAKDGFAFGGSYALYTAYVSGVILENYFLEVYALHYNASGSNNTTLRSNYIRRAGCGVYCSGGAGFNCYDNKWGYIEAASNYGHSTVLVQGLVFANTGITTPGVSNFYNDDIIYSRAMSRVATGASIDVFFENTVAQKVFNSKIFSGGDELLTLGAGTRVAFKNYLGAGGLDYITENGVVTSEPDAVGGLQWGGVTHEADFSMSYRKNTIVTKPNVPISVTAKIKIDNADYYSGIHTLPTLKISGLGVTQAQAEVSVLASTDWQFITATGVPTSTGYLDIEISYQSDSAERKVIIDNIEVLAIEPRVTTDQDTTYRAGSVDTIISEKITAFGVWSADRNINYGAGSFGEANKNKVPSEDIEDYKGEGSSTAEIANAVWAHGTRALTTFGTLIEDLWGNSARTLTAGTRDDEIDNIADSVSSLPTTSGLKTDERTKLMGLSDDAGGLKNDERTKLMGLSDDAGGLKNDERIKLMGLPDDAGGLKNDERSKLLSLPDENAIVQHLLDDTA